MKLTDKELMIVICIKTRAREKCGDSGAIIDHSDLIQRLHDCGVQDRKSIGSTLGSLTKKGLIIHDRSVGFIYVKEHELTKDL